MSKAKVNSTNAAWSRFDSKAEYYHQYRLPYPSILADWFAEIIGSTALPVADIGAGTGLASIVLAEAGYSVFAVEPSAEMREVGKRSHCESFPIIRYFDGHAEATSLGDKSVSAIVLADSVQWLKLSSELKREFQRISANCSVPIIIVKSSFWHDSFGSKIHDLLLEHPAVESNASIDHSNIELETFFFNEGISRTKVHDYEKTYSPEQLYGRVLSDSHVSRVRYFTDLRSEIFKLVQLEMNVKSTIAIQHRCRITYGILQEDLR